jgi:hypothetical protein
MAPMGPFPSGPQPGSVRGPLPMTGGGLRLNGFGGPPMQNGSATYVRAITG